MMCAKLFHIYGPLFINSYGVAIALGLFILIWRVQKDTVLKQYLTEGQLYNVLMLGILSGVVGGRLLYLATNWEDLNYWHEAFAVWQGGLSITGVILSILISEYIYLRMHGIPFFAISDRFAIYAPLAQAFGRVGCFFAGCCHGIVSTVPWSITYTDKDSFAPLYIPLHPAQLYSAVVLAAIFIFLYWFSNNSKQPRGVITLLYLILVGTERFIIDFWRGDRSFALNNTGDLSVHQLLSGGIVVIACASLAIILLNKKSAQRHNN